ncbi:MAG TPA: glycine zipper family protein [Burkholderiales bacterium]|nr:glycine zipper family protein [Burkholderiales bacterium]
MKRFQGVVLVTLSLALVAPLQAQPVIYPAKGQSAQQQQRDDGECYGWAKGNTGIDPAVVAGQAPPPAGAAVGGGERVRGAARGAVGGAAIGAIAGDTGKGAAIGAAAGTMAGGHRARQNQAAQQQGAQQAKQDQINTFYRAYGACMEGRGYTVK